MSEDVCSATSADLFSTEVLCLLWGKNWVTTMMYTRNVLQRVKLCNDDLPFLSCSKLMFIWSCQLLNTLYSLSKENQKIFRTNGIRMSSRDAFGARPKSWFSEVSTRTIFKVTLTQKSHFSRLFLLYLFLKRIFPLCMFTLRITW